MTVYAKESVLYALAKCSKKTYRKWVWKVIPRVAGAYSLIVSCVCYLPCDHNTTLWCFFLCVKICWENRFIGNKGRTCLVSVDGTDYSVNEQQLNPFKRPKRNKDGRCLKFDPKWWSHKFNGPAVRYKTAVNIQTGNLVWTHGPFPAGNIREELF